MLFQTKLQHQNSTSLINNQTVFCTDINHNTQVIHIRLGSEINKFNASLPMINNLSEIPSIRLRKKGKITFTIIPID